MVYAALLAVLVLSILEVVTGANDLTSSGAISATLVATMPIMLAGLGGLWSERAGIVNIGLEGMLILGTYGAGYFGYHYGAWAGVIGAILMGMLGGLIHAIATVVFGVDHIISGVAINIIALGSVQYLASLTFAGLPGGGSTQSPKIGDVPTITIEPLSDALLDIEKKDWFFVSELAAIGRSLCNGLSVLVVISLLLLVVTWWVLWRTAFGLRLRSCGESPAAAESLGVKVLRYKFVAVLISGGLAGLGGAVLAMVAASNYRDGQTGGRGYIGLAAMIFGNWRPGGLLAGVRTVRLHRDALACARAAPRSTRCCSRPPCWRSWRRPCRPAAAAGRPRRSWVGWAWSSASPTSSSTRCRATSAA